MILKHLTEQDYLFLKSMPLILNHNYRLNHVQMLELFGISNRLTGKQERPGSCGRCLYNVRERLKAAVERYPKQI